MRGLEAFVRFGICMAFAGGQDEDRCVLCELLEKDCQDPFVLHITGLQRNRLGQVLRKAVILAALSSAAGLLRETMRPK